jgi:hypothetical protein
MSAKCRKIGNLIAAMFSGAFFVDSQVTNHFADVAYFNVVKFWHIGKALPVPFNSVTVSCSADVEAIGAAL